MCEVIAMVLILRFDKKIILKTVYKQLPLIAQHKNTWKENTKYNSYTESTPLRQWGESTVLHFVDVGLDHKPGLASCFLITGSTTKGLKT